MEITLGYNHVRDFKLVEHPQKNFDKLQKYLTEVHRTKHNVLMHAKRGVVSKVLTFSYLIEVLANTSTAEASVYRAELENIFNNGSVRIEPHSVKPCALINDPDENETPNWYTVHFSDKEWSWMWCSSRCKV